VARFLLDTSVLIDFSKGIPASVYGLETLAESGDELCVCSIVITEFVSGLRPVDRPNWIELLSSMRYLPESQTMAIDAGRYRYHLARLGRSISTTDVLIAAVARAWDATLLTENPKHFELDGLVVRSLRS
jgi:predicted nucleic acid-binding protein